MFRRAPQLNFAATAPNGQPVEYDTAAIRQLMGMNLEDLWRTQPHLRTVVSFLARNIAQCGLHTFERVSDTDRVRDHDSVTARTLAAPNETMTTYDLVTSLVADTALYDIAYWWVSIDDSRPSGWRIDPIPPSWVVASGGGSRWAPEWYDVQADKRKSVQRIKASEMVVFPGWNPGSPGTGSSPVDALKAVLSEQIHAYIYRQQVWQRAGRVGDVLTRPAGAPEWSNKARTRFSKDWNAKWSGNDGPLAGGTPILEDGMTLEKLRFSAHEEEWIEAAKLSLATVAQVYHVNPTMIGLLDNANFSNVREFRRSLYGDTLGPTLAMIEGRINTFLMPMLGEKPNRYTEFNIREKLEGSFEEQAAVMSTLVGRPIMSADEGRSKFNLPALGGNAAELVTPLNVLVGGQASPRDGETAGGGGPVPDAPSAPAAAAPVDAANLTAEETAKLVNAAASLIRSGFDPEASLIAVGLDPIKHLGLLPVTIQKPQAPENVDQDLADELAKSGGASVKAADTRTRFKSEDLVPDTYRRKAEDVFRKFFERQGKSVLTAMGAKAGPDWWDSARWDKELADDLFRLAVTTSAEMGKAQAAALGFTEGDYDVDRTLAFLRAVAESRAGMVNAATLDALQDAKADPDKDPAAVFTEAAETRTHGRDGVARGRGRVRPGRSR